MRGMRPLFPTLLATVVTAAVLVTGCGPFSRNDPDASPELVEALKTSRERFPEARQRKIVMLGMDSCDPDLVDDMIRRGKLPNFARLRREGARGSLRSIQPLLSPVVWTSISTGMTPERHGIFDFVTEQNGQAVPVSSHMRQADTVWELLARSGVSVGVVGWLVSYPADPLPGGFLVTDRVGVPAFEYGKERVGLDAPDVVYPAELAKEIEQDLVDVDDVTLGHVRPFADVTEDQFAAAYTRVFSPLNLLGNLRLTLADAETYRRAGTRLLREKKPQFFACYFEAMDALSHFFMRYAPPKMEDVEDEKFDRFRTAIEANYMWHDQALGEFMELCDDRTTLVLVSDHGFKSGKFRRNDPSDFHAKTGAMWHREYGVVYLWGNGVARGAQLRGASIYDVAPTVLASMGYPVPEDMRMGRVLEEAFDPPLEYVKVPTYFGESRRARLAADTLDRGIGDGETLTPEAAEELERLKSLGYISGDRSDPASTQLTQAGRLMAQGRFKEAHEIHLAAHKRAMEDARATGRISTRTHFALARTYLRLGEVEKAEELLAEAQQYDSDPFEALMFRVDLCRAREDWGGAEIASREARDLNPTIYQVHNMYSLVMRGRMDEYDEAGNGAEAMRCYQEARNALERSLELEPRQFESLKQLAKLRLAGPPRSVGPSVAEVEEIERARDELERALELVPDYPEALNNYAVALMRLGLAHRGNREMRDADKRLQEALDALELNIRKHPNNVKAWANKSYVLWQMDRLDAAFESAVRTRELEPDYTFNPGLLQAFEAKGLQFTP